MWFDVLLIDGMEFDVVRCCAMLFGAVRLLID